MTLELAIDIAEPDWLGALPHLEMVAEAAVAAAIGQAAPDLARAAPEIQIGLIFADDARLRELNRAWREKDKPTNVLSFPLTPIPAPRAGVPLLLGDIVLSLDTIAREAEDEAKDFADHTRHMIVHGVLHLLGHDHEADDEAEIMEALEIKILFGLGVSDPYICSTTSC